MSTGSAPAPPQYGFVIDHRKCIGCHACTVACKAENEVPVGKFRTWVKYTERGAFPQVRRHFTVLRCNHCDAAPCVDICPVGALSKRPDAIVDLDRGQCIGCRACMQACPYDALYFHDEDGVAEKCHYCAHRTEVGLEPACVVVCPVQAIVAGDASDPESPIARLVAEQPVTRRKLEKGTRPRVWYVEADADALVPSRVAEPSAYLWSERAPFDLPAPAADGVHAPPSSVATLDVPHPPAWGWHVWAYLVTKNVAAGAALVAPFLGWLGVRSGAARDLVPEAIALLFLAITNVLLVHDLGRPERFWKILLQPNTRSWLVKGAWVLTAFGVLLASTVIHRLVHLDEAADVIRWATLPVALLAAGYSAFLFAQCRGRDLWLEKGLFGMLCLRAALCGAALAMLLPSGGPAVVPPAWLFAALAAANAAALVAEARSPGETADASRGFAILRSRLARSKPALVLAGAAVLAVAGLGLGPGLAAVDLAFRAIAALQALLALGLFERAWIRAGQEVPIS